MTLEELNRTSPFHAGAENTAFAPYFDGTSYLNMLSTEQVPVGCVTFAPGCRNHWHTHPGGQILLCTDGAGRYQERGKPVVCLQPGDVVKIAPGAEHWHGAAPDTPFSHIAIETHPEAGPAVWLEPVSDEDYLAEPALRQTPAGRVP